MLNLIITTVDKQLFHGNVHGVICPGVDGELTVLAHHTPLITILKKGTIKILKRRGEEKEEINCSRGLLEVSGNKATILV